MFAHFIYFIIALLILSLYQAPDELPYSLSQSLFLFIGASLLYTLYTRRLFQSLLRKVEWDTRAKLDHRFGQLTTRCAVLSLIMLCIDVWWLNLPAFLNTLPLFSTLPTLNSLMFLLLFVGYLTLMWIFSYDAHRAIYQTDISIKSYVYSNVAFSVPVLIPWTLLFGINDLIRLLPFELPKRLIDTPIGQTVYFLLFLIVAAIFAPVLIQRFWRCRPLEPGEPRSRIEALCRKADVRYADIVYWPIFGGRMITAGVMGLVARFRYILITDALLKLLKPDEVDQVIAHEIGHVKRKHLMLYLLFFIGFMLISYVVFPMSELLLFSNGPLLYVVKVFHLNPFKAGDIFSGITLVICIIIYFRFIFGYFIRNFERQADVYVFHLFPTAHPLISTFDKIVASSGQPADKPNWHHFSIQQRIDYLWHCEQSSKWIDRHNKKVTKSIFIYLICLCILVLTSFKLNQIVFNDSRQRINIAVIEAYENYMDHKEKKTLGDAVNYLLAANIYYSQKHLAQAVSAYESSLAIKPDNPDALNNLAWLLATEKESKVYDPIRALALAKKAIAIEKAPHIWDTLAECYFANDRIEEAIDAELRALEMKPIDRKIYEDQLAKFKKALKEKGET